MFGFGKQKKETQSDINIFFKHKVFGENGEILFSFITDKTSASNLFELLSYDEEKIFLENWEENGKMQTLNMDKISRIESEIILEDWKINHYSKYKVI